MIDSTSPSVTRVFSLNHEAKPKRPIRSFVRREGRMTARQKLALEKFWPLYGLNVADGQVDFPAVFGRKSTVVFEIGFGVGASLFEMARQNQAQDFIGVEVHRPGVGALLAQINQFGLTNVRIFQEDVLEVLKQAIPDSSLDKILILFPDPWPKKRHNKRRLIQPAFVELLRQKLKVAGEVHLATDWEEYAEEMMTVFSSAKGFSNPCGVGQYLQESNLHRFSTKFEQRGKRLGHGIRDLLFTKIA